MKKSTGLLLSSGVLRNNVLRAQCVIKGPFAQIATMMDSMDSRVISQRMRIPDTLTMRPFVGVEPDS